MNNQVNTKNTGSVSKSDKPVASMENRPQTPTAQQESGFLSRISDRFNSALQNSRGGADLPAQRPVIAQRPVEEVSISRIRSNKTQKMYIPEGVVIKGAITGGSDTEIHGRVEGDVIVDAAIFLGKNALVTGSIRASSCQIEGMVKGCIECAEDLVLTANGRIASDASAGKQVRIAGSVEGNVTTPGILRIEAGGVVNGDVQARVFSMSEGAELNGRCTMRAPMQQETLFDAKRKGDN